MSLNLSEAERLNGSHYKPTVSVKHLTKVNKLSLEYIHKYI